MRASRLLLRQMTEPTGVARLDASRPLPGVARHRWSALIADFTSFLASRWAARAAILGWSSAELFGYGSEKPLDEDCPCYP